jgi:hypothetical protein
MSPPKITKVDWHSSIIVRSMPQTMFLLQERVEGHREARSERRTVVHWCPKFPVVMSVVISASFVDRSHRILLQALSIRKHPLVRLQYLW